MAELHVAPALHVSSRALHMPSRPVHPPHLAGRSAARLAGQDQAVWWQAPCRQAPVSVAI